MVWSMATLRELDVLLCSHLSNRELRDLARVWPVSMGPCDAVPEDEPCVCSAGCRGQELTPRHTHRKPFLRNTDDDSPAGSPS